MDEVHYLADRFRGAVWEEVIIHLPESVRLVSLSATVSATPRSSASGCETVRGDTAVIVEEHRPVPLWQHVLVGDRLYDLFVDGDPATPRRRPQPAVNPRADAARCRGGAARARTARRARPHAAGAGRAAAIRHAEPGRTSSSGSTPTGCCRRSPSSSAGPAATPPSQQCLRAGLRLTEPERAAPDPRDRRARAPPRSPTRTSTSSATGSGSTGSSAASPRTTPGMLPAFKEIVEELFVAGLVKAVFATETLALGINMPARRVVLEKLVKWNGEAHVDLTPGEYTQLTGRAGRRGIDVEGHAVVLWTPGLDPRRGGRAGLDPHLSAALVASGRPTTWRSTWSARSGAARARELLETSFAQFQADRAVVGLARQVRRNERGARRLRARR